MLGIQALVPLMPAGSSIVNICSVAAMSGHAAAAYTASTTTMAATYHTVSRMRTLCECHQGMGSITARLRAA